MLMVVISAGLYNLSKHQKFNPDAKLFSLELKNKYKLSLKVKDLYCELRKNNILFGTTSNCLIVKLLTNN